MPLNKQNIPFLDLSEEFNDLREQWYSAISEIGQHGRYILGPNVTAFEQESADYLGVVHAIGVANGTDALILSMRTLNFKPDDEVITSPYTFFASSEAIFHAGAKTVFADVDAETFNIDPDKLEQYITPRTRAIVVVHIFGCPADMKKIMAIAGKHNLAVFEDSAQAFGAVTENKKIGAIGTAGCFSFYPTKVLGCYGDGGLITTDDDGIDARIRKLRNHGATAAFTHDEMGYNSRLDEIQAALLRLKLKKIDADIARRRQHAETYRQQLQQYDVICPQDPPGGRHVYNLFTIRSTRRDKIQKILSENGVPTSLCYPKPLHLQAVYESQNYKPGDLPVAEQLSRESLSLPIYPALREEHISHIADLLGQAFA